MILQIAIGSIMMVATVIFAGLSAWSMESLFSRSHNWLMREPHRPKLMLVVLLTALWALLMVTAEEVAALAAFKVIVPALMFTLRAMAFSAPAVLSCSVPELTVTSPVKVLAAERVRVLLLDFSSRPAPEITPERVWAEAVLMWSSPSLAIAWA